MPQETTVLLIDAHHFNAALEEQLGARQVYVEHATSNDAVQVASVLVPDLVVVSGKSGADTLALALANVRPAVPTIVVADRAQVKKLKEREQELPLAALVPHDLPTAAIAHRIATMARKSASGELTLKPIRTSQTDIETKSIASSSSATAPSGAIGSLGATAPSGVSTTRGRATSIAATKRVTTGANAQATNARTAAGTGALATGSATNLKATLMGPAAGRTPANASKSTANAGSLETKKETTKIGSGLVDKLSQKATGGANSREASRSSTIKPAAASAPQKETPKQKKSAREKTDVFGQTQPFLQAKTRPSLKPEPSLRPTLIGVAAPAQAPIEKVAEDSVVPTQRGLATTDLSTKSVRPAQFVPLPLEDLDPDSISFSEMDPGDDEETVRLEVEEVKRLVDPQKKEANAAKVAKAERAAPFFATAQPSSPPNSARGDELSMVAQLPVDLRLPLSTAKKPSTALRLAFLDTDLTRADLLAGAMRRKGLEVFPLTPDIRQTRWPLLRRFAPQALVVDEKGMARKDAEWVETFRGDPFLRHVPLIVLRLSRLYHEEDGNIDLDPLLTLAEHLGQDEAALLEKLAPAREVDLKMTQIGPVRLLQLLTEQDRNTRIDCRGADERIAWPLGPGYAGNAKLLGKTGDKVLAKLPPKEALAWILRHEDLDVAVHEHTEPLAHASESVDSAELLKQVTDELGIPERHQSLRPGDLPAELSRHLLSSRATGDVEPSDLLEAVDDEPLATKPTEDSPLPVEIPSAPRLPQLSGLPVTRSFNSPSRLNQALEELRSKTGEAYSAYKQRLAPLEQKVPLHLRKYLAPASLIAAGLCVALLILSLGPGGDSKDRSVAAKRTEANVRSKAEASQPKKTQPPAQANLESKAAEEPEAAATKGDLWHIAPDSHKDGCEIVVGDKKPEVESPANAQNYLRQGRKLLLIGKTEDAIELMCLSGLSDPKGPAAESLAEYYLGLRSLGQAEHWVKISLQADPERRRSQELLADIENQKGNHDKSRELLLKTMKLSGTETSTLAAIGRKLIADARQASKGGDLPRAERALRRAAVLVPESSGAALELAQVLADRKMTEAALLWAEHAYTLDPSSNTTLYFAGNLAAQVGKAKAARKYFQRIPPGDPLYQKAVARVAELGD